MSLHRTKDFTRFKVGLFTLVGFLSIGSMVIIISDQPYWWRSCQVVEINVEDATGLKSKSPIRSLGIEIGYLKSVSLTESHVRLGICLTAPVEVLPETRAYIRAEGFLGDKFVELKPVRYVGSTASGARMIRPSTIRQFAGWVLPAAYAGPQPDQVLQSDSPSIDVADAHRRDFPRKGNHGREIPVGENTGDVQNLVGELGGLTKDLRQSLNPEDLKKTLNQINRTLEHLGSASRNLSPEGKLNQTAQRTLAKLEDAIEQIRDLTTRINQGEGSLGRLINDPTYADEIKLALQNLNKLLNKVGQMQFVVDIGGVSLPRLDGGRGWFQLGIWPSRRHYYLLGVTGDSRGKISNMTINTTAGGTTQTTQVQTIEQTGILFTAMVGRKFFERADVSVGALYGDGALSTLFSLWPDPAKPELFQIRADFFVRNAVAGYDARLTFLGRPIPEIPQFYVRAGFDSVKGLFKDGGPAGPSPFYGAGITFTDEDIKLLFALK